MTSSRKRPEHRARHVDDSGPGGRRCAASSPGRPRPGRPASHRRQPTEALDRDRLGVPLVIGIEDVLEGGGRPPPGPLVADREAREAVPGNEAADLLGGRLVVDGDQVGRRHRDVLSGLVAEPKDIRTRPPSWSSMSPSRRLSATMCATPAVKAEVISSFGSTPIAETMRFDSALISATTCRNAGRRGRVRGPEAARSARPGDGEVLGIISPMTTWQ